MVENATAPASSVRVARLQASFLVPQHHPSPAAVRSRLNSVAQAQLAPACARTLTPLWPDNDPSVWFIRQLDVEVAVDAAWEVERLAEVWATQLARALQRKLSLGDDSTDILRFPSRVAYLAQFLRDLSEGVAWSKWYYADFEGLRTLPTSAAVREALCREPSLGEAALQQLVSDGWLEKVLSTLSEADCRATLVAFCSTESDAEAPVVTAAHLQAIWRVWQRIPALAWEYAPQHHALQLYLALRRDEPVARPASALLLTIRVMLALARWIASPQGDRLLKVLRRSDSAAFAFAHGGAAELALARADRLLDVLRLRDSVAFDFVHRGDTELALSPADRLPEALRGGDIASLFALARSDDGEALAALLRCERSVAVAIAEQLRSSGGHTAPVINMDSDMPLFMPFGGIFYLLRHLGELDVEELVARLPDFEGEPPTALVRFLVLLKCLGGERAPRAFFDPVLREVAGVASDLSTDNIRAWVWGVKPKMIRDFQARWMASCYRRGAASTRWLCLHPARCGRLLMLADSERDMWLRTFLSATELARTLEKGWLGDECPKALLCDPTLAEQLPVVLADMPVRTWDSLEALAWAAEDAALATCIERVRPADADLGYLSVMPLLRRARHLDLALSLVARGLLRSFAWRLPGFAWSSADYLYANFLNVAATIEPESDRWLVRLARPPLHIVLAMTGAAQDNYHIPWLGGRQVQLTSGDL